MPKYSSKTTTSDTSERLTIDMVPEASEKGVPALVQGTPLGPALIIVPERSDDAEANCEAVQHLIRHGVPDHQALEAMQVFAGEFYWWQADALRGQVADLEKTLRQYRRRAAADSREIARLNEQLTNIKAPKNGELSQ